MKRLFVPPQPDLPMLLDAVCRLEYCNLEDVTAVFMLRPRSGWAQWVMREEFHIHPQVPVIEFTDVYGNLCQRVVMPTGNFRLMVSYRVQVADEVDADADAPLMKVQDLPTDVHHFLLPSRYCQSDCLGALAHSITDTFSGTYQKIAQIQYWIHQNVAYCSGSSDSSTSAIDTANHRQGVCRDFAHLGISLCRALDVPARMVVGFLNELQPMDLHAWYEAFIDGRWYVFDPTQPATTGNRIVIAYGRDAADVALATLFGNFQLRHMAVSVTPVWDLPSDF
jgi:transglutaminase-like putative cysteine protease